MLFLFTAYIKFFMRHIALSFAAVRCSLIFIKESAAKMEIRETRNGTELTVDVAGELNVSTAAELDAYLDKNLGGADTLIFDFKDLNFISSAGMRSMLAAHKMMHGSGGSMTIRNCSQTVKDVFEIVGFDAILHFE